MTEPERTFPFITGDRIRLTNWAEGKHNTAAHPPKWVRVGGYGQVYFIGTTDDGTEHTYYKNAKMAYNDEWELYAPAPDERAVFVTFDEGNNPEIIQRDITGLDPTRYAQLRHGTTVWKCQLTPETRIYP